jgi:hypothetical protein
VEDEYRISPPRHEGHEGVGEISIPNFVLFVTFVVNKYLTHTSGVDHGRRKTI